MSKECFKNCYILGPTEPRGLSETINIHLTFTTDEDNAKVIDVTGGSNHILDFYIPKGKNENGITLKGSYDTFENGTSEEISALENERISISRRELDSQGILTLDSIENLIYLQTHRINLLHFKMILMIIFLFLYQLFQHFQNFLLTHNCHFFFYNIQYILLQEIFFFQVLNHRNHIFPL